MSIHIAKFENRGEVFWSFFEHGKFQTPFFMISDYQFKQLIQYRNYRNEEMEEDEK